MINTEVSSAKTTKISLAKVAVNKQPRVKMDKPARRIRLIACCSCLEQNVFQKWLYFHQMEMN